jgi:acyl-CoA synthetase (AMP-forming)/AMP-acid ligase II
MRRAVAQPDTVAIGVVGGQDLTFGDWDTRSNALGRALVERRVQAGDVVVLLFDNLRWVDFAVAYAAVLKAGAVALPLAPSLDCFGLRRICSQAGAAGVLCPVDLAAPAGDAWVDDPVALAAGQQLRAPSVHAGASEDSAGSPRAALDADGHRRPQWWCPPR